jgi:hypothetical protein
MTLNELHDEHKPEKVLVTGGGGFLGKAIASRLVERGDQVRSLARNFFPSLKLSELLKSRAIYPMLKRLPEPVKIERLFTTSLQNPLPGDHMQITIKPMLLVPKTLSRVASSGISRG